ncbi:MAG: TIGR02444 family protein [Porticoccaceae bacterium]|nr:TIGR02444 family protein [Pseudomonadales bacterium]MCP5172846.1 TIGR02444 family protein [Pseudomonadales bacterium]MCP5302320.1 TIGR02444 family protein [Pseudomonadales bacterium]
MKKFSARSNPFWQYSLALYAVDRVKEICLDWQDSRGANVNMLLLCCWLAAQGVDINRVELLQLQALIEPLDRRFVRQIRHLRRQLDNRPGETEQTLRQQLLAAEMSAEFMVQNQLYQRILELKAVIVVPASAEVGANGDEADNRLLSNLNEYLDLIGIEPIDNKHTLVRAAKSVNMQTL